MNDVELPLSEHSEWNMTEKPFSKDEMDKLFDGLAKECSERDACGCKGIPPSVESFEKRMSTMNQTFEKGGISQNIKGENNTQCSKESVENLLTRYLHPQTLQDIKSGNGDNISMRQATGAWEQVRSICANDVPTTIEEFYQ